MKDKAVIKVAAEIDRILKEEGCATLQELYAKDYDWKMRKAFVKMLVDKYTCK